MAVSKGHIDWLDAGGPGSAGRPRGERAVGHGDWPHKTGVGSGIRRLVPSGYGLRPLGLLMGGRHLQRPEDREAEAVRPSGHWHQRMGENHFLVIEDGIRESTQS